MLILSKEDYFFCCPKENIMQTPEWLKPGLYGAACGAAALAVIG
jgi:hypothetical protein